MKKRGIFTANNCELLEEMLKTEKPISFFAFKSLVKSGLYEYYCFDSRIDADRYLIKDISGNLGLPTWINDYDRRAKFN